MNKATVATLAVVLGSAAAGGASYYADTRPPQQVEYVGRFPTPTLSASSIRLPGRDSVAIAVRWTRRCALVNRRRVCPDTFAVTMVPTFVENDSTWFGMTQTRRSPSLRVTMIAMVPVCPERRTIIVRVAAEDKGQVERSFDAVTEVPIICRTLSAAERRDSAAYADSFPDGSRKIVPAGVWTYKPDSAYRRVELLRQLRGDATAADSAETRAKMSALDTMPDSLPVMYRGDTTVVRPHYSLYFCLLGRNRYTGETVILGGSPSRCERARAQWASVRSG